MTEIRIAHLSDLHFRRSLPGMSSTPHRRSREVLPHLRRALREIKDHHADFIAITGDLLDVPHWFCEGDDYFDYPYALTQSRTLDDYQFLKNLLDETGIPFMAVPGNHDHPRSFFQVFPDGPWERELAGFRILGFPDREWEGNHPQRLDRERRRWEAALGGDDPRPQVHLQHFLITPDRNKGYPHNYLEAENLLEGNRNSDRVKLVLQGHFHEGSPLGLVDSTYYSTAPAFCVAPFPWRLYMLSVGQNPLQIQSVDFPAPMPSAPRKAVFLDRDGVINTLDAYDTGPQAMELIPGSADAIRRLHQAGYAVVVVSNQSCVARGYVTPYQLAAVFDRMNELLAAEAGEEAMPDASYFTLQSARGALFPKYAKDDEPKPAPTLILRACRELHLDAGASWMIGDRATDLLAGAAVSCRGILVKTGRGATEIEACMGHPLTRPEFIAENLSGAVDHILLG